MPENQEEKIQKILKKYDIKIKDVQEALGEIGAKGKGPYYDRVRKQPLDQEFIDLLKKRFKLDLVLELNEYDRIIPTSMEVQSTLTVTFDANEVKRIIFENSDLHKKLEGILEDRLKKSEEVNDVFRERDKLKKENITLKKKIK